MLFFSFPPKHEARKVHRIAFIFERVDESVILDALRDVALGPDAFSVSAVAGNRRANGADFLPRPTVSSTCSTLLNFADLKETQSAVLIAGYPATRVGFL